MNARSRRLGPGLLACAAAIFAAAGQEPGLYRLTVDVPQVVLNVTVVTKDGIGVPGLSAGDFLVYDQGKLQELSAFSSEERPATIGLVLDNSRSMTPIRSSALQAATAFVDVSNPNDDFFVVHFNENVRLGFDGGDFSTDAAQVRKALWQLHPDGQTALYDAVDRALHHSLKGRWEKRALLIISDGGDTASAITFEHARAEARRVGASIFAIGVYDPHDPESSPSVLRSLAKAGGGEAYFPTEASEMASICRRIAAEIRSQYTLAFTPGDMGSEGKFHKIRVKVKDSAGDGLYVRTREGYYEPGEEQ